MRKRKFVRNSIFTQILILLFFGSSFITSHHSEALRSPIRETIVVDRIVLKETLARDKKIEILSGGEKYRFPIIYSDLDSNNCSNAEIYTMVQAGDLLEIEYIVCDKYIWGGQTENRVLGAKKGETVLRTTEFYSEYHNSQMPKARIAFFITEALFLLVVLSLGGIYSFLGKWDD